MGRLRGDYESPLFQKMTAEIVELFGIDDAVLFRWEAADNQTNRDPLYGEPTTVPLYKSFRIKAHKVDPDQDEAADPEGRDITSTLTVFVAMKHLLGAAVQPDRTGDYVSEGDVIGLYKGADHIQYDIIKTKRDGWVNDSASFSGYTLSCVRREKYLPERKTAP